MQNFKSYEILKTSSQCAFQEVSLLSLNSHLCSNGILSLTSIYPQLYIPPLLFYPLRSHLFFCPRFLNASLNPIPQFLSIFQQHLVPYQAFFMLLISPHPFIPQIPTSSSAAHINLSVTSFLDTYSCPANIMVPSHDLGLQSPITSLTKSNSILHFICHVPIFPQSWLFYLGNGNSKAGGSSNMMESFNDTIWCKILDDIIIFMEDSHNANVRTKQIRRNLQAHSKLFMFLVTNY